MKSLFTLFDDIVTSINSALRTTSTSKPTPTQNAKMEPSKAAVEEDNILHLNGIDYKFQYNAKSKEYEIFYQNHIPRVKEMAGFGKKLLPSTDFQWEKIASYQASCLEHAVHTFVIEGYPIRNKLGKIRDIATDNAKERVTIAIENTPGIESRQNDVSKSVATAPSVGNVDRTQKPVVGKLTFAGKKTFPDKDKPGSTYENFAVEVQTHNGPKTLQGEGLEDALAEAGATIGSSIEVHRRGTTTVGLFNKTTKEPILDEEGKQKQGLKRLWKIKLTK